MINTATPEPASVSKPADLSGRVAHGALNKAVRRAGWAHDAMAIAKLADDKLTWPEFANTADKDLKW